MELIKVISMILLKIEGKRESKRAAESGEL